MIAAAIVNQVSELGVELTLVGDRIRYAPKSRLPEDLLEVIKVHKQEVLYYLKTENDRKESELLSWATKLGEWEIILTDPIGYVESERRVVTTKRISWYAANYLKTICFARARKEDLRPGPWQPEWWKRQEEEAIASLKNLRKALVERGDLVK